MHPMLKWAPAAGAGLALAAGVASVASANREFSRLIQTDIAELLSKASSGSDGATVVTREMLEPLPEPVRRYLAWTGVLGQRIPRVIRLRQRGRMRLARGQPWFPLHAVEHYSVRPPGFVWDGTASLGPLHLARARDMYQDGHGHMLVKVASRFAVVDARGEEMDQSALVRYLSEMIWFPAAFLRDNVSFEAVDGTSSRVILSDQGHTVAAILRIDGEGRLTGFVAQRYQMVGKNSRLETWSTPITGYGEFEGLRLPTRGKAVFNLADGDLEYIDVTLTELAYDLPSSEAPLPVLGQGTTR